MADDRGMKKGFAFETAAGILLAVQTGAVILYQALLMNGTVAARMMRNGEHERAVELIKAHDISPSEEVSKLIREETDDAAECCAAGKISCEKALKRVHRFDGLEKLGYKTSAETALAQIENIAASRECCEKIEMLIGDEKDVILSCAKALALFDELSPEDEQSLEKADELKERCFERAAEYLDETAAKKSLNDYFAEAGRFIENCGSEKDREYFIGLCGKSCSEFEGKLENTVASLMTGGEYESCAELILSAEDFYANDSEFGEYLELSLEKCVTKQVSSLAAEYSFGDTDNAFEFAAKFSDRFASAGLAETVCGSFKNYISLLMSVEDYKTCAEVIEHNERNIKAFSSEFDESYEDMLCGVYTKWIDLKKRRGEYMAAEDGLSAFSLAKKQNSILPDSCDMNALAVSAAEYEKKALVKEINRDRASAGSSVLRESRRAYLLAEQLLSGGGDVSVSAIKSAAEACGIEILSSELIDSIFIVSDKTYAEHSEFLASLDREVMNTICLNRNFETIGMAVTLDMDNSGFKWLLVLMPEGGTDG